MKINFLTVAIGIFVLFLVWRFLGRIILFFLRTIITRFYFWLILFFVLPTAAYFTPSIVLAVIYYLLTVVVGWILVHGILILPNKPPHFGLVTRWERRAWRKNLKGEPVAVVVTEGWNWLFLKGIVFKVILINNSKRSKDFFLEPEEEIIQTPDGVTSRVRSSIAYDLDESNIINFLNLGGDGFTSDTSDVSEEIGKLEGMLDDIARDKIRTWARKKIAAPKEDPQNPGSMISMTWEDLQDSKEEAVKELIQGITGNDTIGQDVINKIRSGDGKWPIKHFGINLKRLNITKVEPFGEVYEKALQLKNEQKDRDSENYELTTDLEKAKALQKYYKNNQNVNKSIDQCMDKIMEWKITREGQDKMSIKSLIQQIKSGGLKL